MRIPASFTLDGWTWKVKLKKLSGGDVGQCVYTDHIIYLDPRQSAEAMAQSFIHELLHALLPDNLELIHEDKLIGKIEGPLFRALSSFEGELAPPASQGRRARRSGRGGASSGGSSAPPTPAPASDDPPA